MICVKCQQEIPDGSVYCNLCGKKQITQQRKRPKRPNYSGSVRKRGKTYQAEWTTEKPELLADGRIRQFRKTKGGFKTRKEAEEYCLKMRDGTVRPKEAPTLKEYWVTYRDKKLPELSKDKV